MNEISHVFIRGRRKGLVKIYTDGGDVSRKRKYHSAFSSRANSLKSQTFSRLCLGNIPETRARAYLSFSLSFFYLSFLQNREKNGEEGIDANSIRIANWNGIGSELTRDMVIRQTMLCSQQTLCEEIIAKR